MKIVMIIKTIITSKACSIVYDFCDVSVSESSSREGFVFLRVWRCLLCVAGCTICVFPGVLSSVCSSRPRAPWGVFLGARLSVSVFVPVACSPQQPGSTRPAGHWPETEHLLNVAPGR